MTYLATSEVHGQDEIIGHVHPVEHIENDLQEGEEPNKMEQGDCHRLVGQQQVVDLVEFRKYSFF